MSRAVCCGSMAAPSGGIRKLTINHRGTENTGVFSVRLWLSELGAKLIFFRVAFDREVDQPVDQLGVWDARSFPQLRVHADRREARHRIYLVHVELAGAALEEEVDTAEAGAIQRFER